MVPSNFVLIYRPKTVSVVAELRPSQFSCLSCLAKREMLRDDITARLPAAQQLAVDNSSHVVTSSQSCDYEVDSDVQDISVADLLIMQSSFDCKYFT